VNMNINLVMFMYMDIYSVHFYVHASELFIVTFFWWGESVTNNVLIVTGTFFVWLVTTASYCYR
jgi:hypothetical protein